MPGAVPQALFNVLFQCCVFCEIKEDNYFPCFFHSSIFLIRKLTDWLTDWKNELMNRMLKVSINYLGFMRRDPARPGPRKCFVTSTTGSTKQVSCTEWNGLSRPPHHEHTTVSMFCVVKLTKFCVLMYRCVRDERPNLRPGTAMVWRLWPNVCLWRWQDWLLHMYSEVIIVKLSVLLLQQERCR